MYLLNKEHVILTCLRQYNAFIPSLVVIKRVLKKREKYCYESKNPKNYSEKAFQWNIKTKEYIMTSQNKEKFHEDPMKTQSKTSTLFKARKKAREKFAIDFEFFWANHSAW